MYIYSYWAGRKVYLSFNWSAAIKINTQIGGWVSEVNKKEAFDFSNLNECKRIALILGAEIEHEAESE